MPLNKVDLSLLFVVVEKTPLSYKIIKAYNTPKLDKRVRFLNVAAEFLNAQKEAIELPKPTPKEGIDPEKLKKSQQAQADILYAQLVQ